MLKPGSRIGSYEIVSPLGSGGMGEVWRVKDTRLGREVAVKALPPAFAQDPERLGRFEREAKVLASLNHANIATLFALEHAGDQYVLVMELVDGEDLSQRLERGPIPLEEALRIALQVAEALEAAHEKGIVHRDLKPANVMLRPDGTVKVLDFGLAKAWESETEESSLSISPTVTRRATAEGVILGTAAYMAPEQARGRKADRRADIWAFGVLLYEMLGGKRLFDGETVSDILAAVLRAEPDWGSLPQELPRPVRRLLTRCLERNPRNRLQAIGDARLEITEVLEGGAEPEPTAVAAAPVPASNRRLWMVGAAALVLVVASSIGAFVIGRGRSEAPPVIRFSLLAPPGRQYHLNPANPGPVTLAPDGHAAAFCARDSVGTVRLYVRTLDSESAAALPGTESAQYPFWSPDSRSLGFFADGKLKRIEAAGGPPLTLCSAPDGKGGSWSQAGVIVFAPSYNAPIQRVSAAGGEPVPVTRFNTVRRENSHRHPRFLPDGKRFLYLARVTSDTTGAGHPIVLGSIDGDTTGAVVTRAPSAVEVIPGYLFFLRESTLMARPFDADRCAFTGEAIPVAEEVMVLGGAAIATFSVSRSGVLAYQRGREGGRRTLEWVDREGKSLGMLGDQASHDEVFISPDGTQAVVRIADTSGKSPSPDLWLYEIARNLRTRFTSDPAADSAPIWSPDSRGIAFASNRSGHFDIYYKALDGRSAETLLYASDVDKFPCGWSPDRKFLLFDSNSQTTDWDIWMLPVDGGEPVPLVQTEFAEFDGVFSPSGRWVAYGSTESGREEVYATPYPGPGRRVRISTDGGWFPCWSSDGSELYFQNLEGRLHAVSIREQGETLEVGTPVPLFSAPLNGDSYLFSPMPDGQRFLLATVGSEAEMVPLSMILNWQEGLSRR